MTLITWGTTNLLAQLEDSSGESATVVFTVSPSFQQSVYMKNTPPPALPTVTGSTAISSYFADYATILPPGGVGTKSATGLAISFQGHGLEFTDGGSVSDTDYKIGLGTHYEELLCYFQVPEVSETVLLGNDSQTNSRGTLQIANIGGTWRFQWKQYESGAVVTYTFDTITVPVTAAGVGVAPAPFYLRFLREVPAATGSGDTGELNLKVNDGTTEQSQTIVPTDRLDTTASTQVARLGGTAAPLSNPKVTVFWHRAVWSDTVATVGTLTSTRWSTPTVYTSTAYSSDGVTALSYLDSGDNANYWQTFGLPVGALSMQGGSRLKFRVAATNTLGGETFPVAYTTMQNEIVEDIGDLQGRYLAVEFLFEVGADYPLAMGGPYLYGEAYGSASHETTQHRSNPVVVPVGGESPSTGTLPYSPDYSTRVAFVTRSQTSKMESAHSVGYAVGTKVRRGYFVRWTLNESEKTILEAFLLAGDGGEQAFTWTAPGDSTTSKAAVVSDLSVHRFAPDAFMVAADLQEVF